MTAAVTAAPEAARVVRDAALAAGAPEHCTKIYGTDQAQRHSGTEREP